MLIKWFIDMQVMARAHTLHLQGKSCLFYTLP
jgi:hypothetical protein